MKLHLTNIGKISSATIELNGITVIAGDNDTGKSTVGKALFAVFNSLYNCQDKINVERRVNLENLILVLFRNAHGTMSYYENIDDLVLRVSSCASVANSPNALSDAIQNEITHYCDTVNLHIDAADIQSFSNRAADSLQITDDVIFHSILQRRLDAEFNEQISNQYSDIAQSEISLEIRGERICVSILNNKVSVTNPRISLGTEAIYIDDPFVLDEVPYRPFRRSRFSDHRGHLQNRMAVSPRETNVVEEIVMRNKLNIVCEKLSEVCAGNIINDKKAAWTYQLAGSDKALDIRNLSTGLKTFVILKLLLVNGSIEPNGTLILDEPEIHLHPAWQLRFAELIVLLHKEFGLHILLNTHSPYFLNAIEVYSAKYGLADCCKYYLAHNVQNASCIEDVTNNVEKIYSTLAKPLQDLENEGYANDDSR